MFIGLFGVRRLCLARFCLEPGGDSPYRRSFTDDLVLGCIPVIFGQLQDRVYPWLWNGWREASRVLIPRTLMVENKIDLFELLSSIPEELLHRMQETIARNACKFQMSLEDDPGDEVHTLLHGAMEASKELEMRVRGS